MIDTITAEGQTVTIKTTEPKPTLLNYLSDPYGCIVDVSAGVTEDGIVAGTGPYKAESLVSAKVLLYTPADTSAFHSAPPPAFQKHLSLIWDCTHFEYFS